MSLKISFECDDKEVIMDFEKQITTLKELSYQKVEENGFDGVSTFIFILSSGAGIAIINALANIIIELIKKDATKNMTIGDVSLTGYNTKEIKMILNQNDIKSKLFK